MFRRFFIILTVFACLSFATVASAGGIPSSPNIGQGTMLKDGPLKLTSNKNAIIKLSQDAASVIVNNPVHASVMLDSPRLLIIIPHAPGTTSFTVLNTLGNVIMQKNIIVSNVQPKYIRIRRICAASSTGCQANSYFYCPDGCYGVTTVSQGDGKAPPPPLRRSSAVPSGSNAPAIILNQAP